MKSTLSRIHTILIGLFAFAAMSSCNKSDDEVTPEEIKTAIALVNIEEGQTFTLEEESTIITDVSISEDGQFYSANLTAVNIETGETIVTDLLGPIPEMVNGGFKTQMIATISFSSPGDYQIFASLKYEENGLATKLASEAVDVNAAALIPVE
ncbi:MULTISPECIES: hypothetical protein [Flammeovirga]|uniref:Uncharacterized protein n=1 Tax=Flammeovirga agarivorans TaxID=2726742 RepID=A0A7X8SIN0_9BACT|nr:MULTISPECIES: hypothetical protein [Flammeovirga]NLR90891.1 hypothetical protein [Flammeovirga agarivorans]